jgi:hypothetical protein
VAEVAVAVVAAAVAEVAVAVAAAAVLQEHEAREWRALSPAPSAWLPEGLAADARWGLT